MADEDKNNSQLNRNKAIDVTKPRETQYSSIDASRVSAYTMREQQSLEKLKKSVGTLDQHDHRASKIKTVVAIILVIILILLLLVLILVIGRSTKSEEENYDVRVSMEIENKSILSIITDTGKEALREINPGDRLPISAYARNSNDYRGDVTTSTSTPPNVYIRFRLRLILNYEERYDVLIPTMSDSWDKFDAEEESQISGGIKTDDHYFYYCGSLAYQRRLELFSELVFDGNVLTCDDGGKYGQIQVLVESIEANPDNLLNDIWPTAPRKWIIDMVAGKYNTNTISDT